MRYFKLLMWASAPLTSALLFAPGQVAAQEQGATSGLLEEIVVTARRREESLQDLPLSIVAISADVMQAQGIYNIDQIGDFVPNLAFTTRDRRHRKAIYIRGIGNDSPGALQPVGAGLYLDGHYMPNTVGQMLSLVDIERVEVLRGPQGTLFGKNTTGGAVNIVSAKPGPEFEADMLLRVADFGQQDLRGVINVPFSDTVAARFNIAKETADGYYFNRTLNTGIGASDLEAFGAAVRIAPNDNWTIDLSARANYQNDDDEGGQCRARPTQSTVDNLANMNPGVLAMKENDPAAYAALVANHPAQIYTGPVYSDGVRQWGGATRYPDGTRANIGGHLERFYAGATVDFWNACNEDNRQGDYVNSQEKDTYLTLDNENVNATIQWDSAGEVGGLDNLNVKLIVSQHVTRISYLQDRDMSSLPIDAIGFTPPGTKRVTKNFELLFTGDVSERLNFVAGVHFFDDRAGSDNNAGDCLELWEANLAAFQDPESTLEVPCVPDGGGQFDRMPNRAVPGGPGVSGRDGYSGSESVAAFGHLTYDLNDNWALDFGARWTDEDRRFHQVEFDLDPDYCSHHQPGDRPATDLCGNRAFNGYILSRRSGLIDGFYNNTSANFSEVTPMVSLTRGVGDDSMVYLLYAEGFLSGSFNDELNAILVPELAPLLTYNPEHVNNYEVGYKGTFANGRLQLSSALFYMEYADKQERISIDNADGRFGGDPQIGITTNAATVDIYGIELEMRAQPWVGGYVSLDVGHLRNTYGAFTSFDPDAPGGSIDRSNLRIEDYSPEWTLNATIEHVFQLGNGAALTPQLGVYWQDDYDFSGGIDGGPPSFCFQEGFSKVRARVSYDPPEGNWQASLFGANISDERYLEVCGGSRSGAFDYRYGQPDTWGLEFTYDWGS